MLAFRLKLGETESQDSTLRNLDGTAYYFVSERHMTVETYRNAPITEAALDIRVRLPEGADIGILEQVQDDGYPNLRQRPVKIEFKVDASNALGESVPKGEITNTPLGFSYSSLDQKQVFQARVDGFTHNRLAPYLNWHSFSAEARRLWGVYREVAKPEIIEILGLNYVNQISIPFGQPFEDYFQTHIHISSELPQGVNTYSLSFQTTWPEGDNILGFVGQSLAPPFREGYSTMVLSIQAFTTVQKPVVEVHESDIWGIFEKLRVVKNSLFEGCISDKVREDIR